MKKKVGDVVSLRLWKEQYGPMKAFMKKRNLELIKSDQEVIDRPDALRELVDAGLEAKGFKTVEV